jgi:hypothetical protein
METRLKKQQQKRPSGADCPDAKHVENRFTKMAVPPTCRYTNACALYTWKTGFKKRPSEADCPVAKHTDNRVSKMAVPPTCRYTNVYAIYPHGKPVFKNGRLMQTALTLYTCKTGF